MTTTTRPIQNEIAYAIGFGWRVEGQADQLVILAKGHRTNHILHLLLSVFTLGLWLPVWAIMALAGGEQRRTLLPDEFGAVKHSENW